MEITLNGNEIKTIQSLHHELKIKLELPDYYGGNLDALWDLLTGWIDLPTTIYWENYSESKKYLGEYAERTVELLQDPQNQIKGFTFKLKP